MEPLTAAALGAALVLVVIAVYLVRDRRRLEFALSERRQAYADVYVQRERFEDRLEHATARNRELALELELHRTSPLIGRTVIANTPKPDDQAIKGVVIRELEGGALLLAGAVYLEPASGRDGPIREVPAGDVVVPRVSWTQLLTLTQEG